jgi:hypothetical protein
VYSSGMYALSGNLFILAKEIELVTPVTPISDGKRHSHKQHCLEMDKSLIPKVT